VVAAGEGWPEGAGIGVDGCWGKVGGIVQVVEGRGTQYMLPTFTRAE
jgi:hypothetical protein